MARNRAAAASAGRTRRQRDRRGGTELGTGLGATGSIGGTNGAPRCRPSGDFGTLMPA